MDPRILGKRSQLHQLVGVVVGRFVGVVCEGKGASPGEEDQRKGSRRGLPTSRSPGHVISSVQALPAHPEEEVDALS